jgi:hypothetical protein
MSAPPEREEIAQILEWSIPKAFAHKGPSIYVTPPRATEPQPIGFFARDRDQDIGALVRTLATREAVPAVKY